MVDKIEDMKTISQHLSISPHSLNYRGQVPKQGIPRYVIERARNPPQPPPQ